MLRTRCCCPDGRLERQTLLALSSARRDALPWLVFKHLDLEDWRDSAALQKRGLRALICPLKKGGPAPLRRQSMEQFRDAALKRPSRQLAEELRTLSQLSLGQVFGPVPDSGTPEAEAEARLLGWSEPLSRRVARLKR